MFCHTIYISSRLPDRGSEHLLSGCGSKCRVCAQKVNDGPTRQVPVGVPRPLQPRLERGRGRGAFFEGIPLSKTSDGE